jgi:hypothetical protein
VERNIGADGITSEKICGAVTVARRSLFQIPNPIIVKAAQSPLRPVVQIAGVLFFGASTYVTNVDTASITLVNFRSIRQEHQAENSSQPRKPGVTQILKAVPFKL